VGYFRVPTKAEFARTVRALRDRGTRVALMYSCGFPAYNYAGQFHDAFRGTGIDGIVSCDYFPDMGHSATLTVAQARFIERLVEFAAGWSRRRSAPLSNLLGMVAAEAALGPEQRSPERHLGALEGRGTGVRGRKAELSQVVIGEMHVRRAPRGLGVEHHPDRDRHPVAGRTQSAVVRVACGEVLGK
jgi:hypothetical protein